MAFCYAGYLIYCCRTSLQGRLLQLLFSVHAARRVWAGSVRCAGRRTVVVVRCNEERDPDTGHGKHGMWNFCDSSTRNKTAGRKFRYTTSGIHEQKSVLFGAQVEQKTLMQVEVRLIRTQVVASNRALSLSCLVSSRCQSQLNFIQSNLIPSFASPVEKQQS